MILGPVDDLAQLVPVVDLLERHLLDRRAGDDQAVVVVVPEVLERVVELDQVILGDVLRLVGRDAHEVDVHLQRRLGDQAQDLGLGLDLLGHEVEDRHAQGADVLLARGLLVQREDGLLVQRCLGGKAVGNVDGHLGSPFRNQCEKRAKISIYAEKDIEVVRIYRESATEGSAPWQS